MTDTEHWLVWLPGGAMTDDRAIVVWDEADLREYYEREWRIEGPFTTSPRGAVEALDRYGKHDSTCAAHRGRHCDCGLDLAFTRLGGSLHAD